MKHARQRAPRHRVCAGVLGSLSLWCAGVSAAGAASEFDPEFDNRAQALVRDAYDNPERARQRLVRLEHERNAPAHRDQLLVLRARLLVVSGDVAAASEIVEQLQASGGPQGPVELLRALIAERTGQSHGIEDPAARAQESLRGACTMGRGADGRSGLPPDCDFRALWESMRLLALEQEGDGALSLAEATARHALDLALAGRDDYLAALSQGALALLSQRQGQSEAATHWLVQGQQMAQFDVRAGARLKACEADIDRRIHDAQGEFRALEEALALATRADVPHLVARLRADLTDAYLNTGRAAEVPRLAREALPILQRFRDAHGERVLRHNAAIAYIKLGQFELARDELARVNALQPDALDPASMIQELVELGEAWAEAGQPREAIRVFREERRLTEQVQARSREVALGQLHAKYDSEGKQRALDVLKREKEIQDQQLANQELGTLLGMAAAGLTTLSLLFVAALLLRVREANRQLKENQALLRMQSERDPLTDLANRRYFLGLMEQRAGADFAGSLLMVDIDHFKRVNDQHGHTVGDVVIGAVAQRLNQIVRSQDLVVRWGGEEFLVFVPGVSPAPLQALADRILRGIADEPVTGPEGGTRVTVSIGFAHFPLPPAGLALHWERAVNWTDMALYMAKAQGRNRAVGVQAVNAADSSVLRTLERDFEAASNDGHVELVTILGPEAA